MKYLKQLHVLVSYKRHPLSGKPVPAVSLLDVSVHVCKRFSHWSTCSTARPNPTGTTTRLQDSKRPNINLSGRKNGIYLPPRKSQRLSSPGLFFIATRTMCVYGRSKQNYKRKNYVHVSVSARLILHSLADGAIHRTRCSLNLCMCIQITVVPDPLDRTTPQACVNKTYHLLICSIHF